MPTIKTRLILSGFSLGRKQQLQRKDLLIIKYQENHELGNKSSVIVFMLMQECQTVLNIKINLITHEAQLLSLWCPHNGSH
jgi:hypothetical protein